MVKKIFEIDDDNAIMVSSFIGRDKDRFIDIRKCWKPDGEDDFVPTRQGVAIPEEMAEKIIKCLKNRLAKLDDEAEELQPRKSKKDKDEEKASAKKSKKSKSKKSKREDD